jgi:hypothetical protein
MRAVPRRGRDVGRRQRRSALVHTYACLCPALRCWPCNHRTFSLRVLTSVSGQHVCTAVGAGRVHTMSAGPVVAAGHGRRRRLPLCTQPLQHLRCRYASAPCLSMSLCPS